MVDPAPSRFRGRRKWDHVLGNLLIAGVGVVLLVVAVVAVPADVLPIRALVGYTLFAVVITLALALALALATELSTVGPGSVAGRPARGVRAWPWEWRYDLAVDAGLVVLAAVVTGLGLRAGGQWVLPGLAVALVGAWFAVRLGLAALGRRRNQAVWLTDDEVVHDSIRGRERCARSAVGEVTSTHRHVVLRVDGAVTATRAPWPWRPRRPRPLAANPYRFAVDCEMIGHQPDQLASWLRAELLPVSEDDPRRPRNR